MVGSRQALEALVDAPVTLLAYPNGRPGVDYTAGTAVLAQSAGFEAAFTTAWGVADASTDPFQLPRFTPWDRTAWRFAGRMLANMRRRPVQCVGAPWAPA
jgi:hypothetical protein